MKKIFLTLVICFISFFIRGHNLDATVRLETQTQIESVQKEIPQSTLVPHVTYTKAYLFQIGVYFGFIAMLIIVNILFFLSTKDNSFIFYVLLIIATNLTIAYHEGLLYPHIKNTFFQYDVDMLLHIANIFVGFKFFTIFLDIKKFYPKTLVFIKIYLGLYLFIMLSYFITDNYLSIKVADIVGFSFLLLLWVFSFFFIKKVLYAKYLSLGFGVFIIAVFINIVFGNLELPLFGNIAYIVRWGAIIEAIILTYVATYRLKVLKEENLAMENAIKKHITRVLHLEKSLHKVTKKEATKQSFTEKLLKLAKNHALTDREIDVLECLTQGLSYEKIAITLFVSKNTIKYHTRNIYEKLGIKTSIEITSKLAV